MGVGDPGTTRGGQKKLSGSQLIVGGQGGSFVNQRGRIITGFSQYDSIHGSQMYGHLQSAPEQRQTNDGEDKKTGPATHMNCVWVKLNSMLSITSPRAKATSQIQFFRFIREEFIQCKIQCKWASIDHRRT